MITFDLQSLLFAAVLLLALAAGAAVWFDRQRRARRQPELDLSALNEAPFAVLWLSENGAIPFANPTAQRLLELPSRPGALPEAAWSDQLLADAEAARRQPGIAGRYRIMPLPPNRLLRWWAGAAGAGGQLIFLFDATEQQRADQAARQLFNDLSHELRTPLATILTHVEVQGLANLPEVTRQESLRLLREEAQRAARLVNGMLELGRLETGGEFTPRPVDLLTVAEAAVQQMMPQAEARPMHLDLAAETPLPAVAGDTDQLLRVLLNLLDNALKFGRPGDKVTLALRRAPAGVTCAVCDTGPGIPAQHLPFVTRRFYRGQVSAQTGSGLGLALVEEILRRHGSALQIESRTQGDAAGTCASFTLRAMSQEEGSP